jgi:hypothetical protein
MSGIPIAGTNQQALLVSDASSAEILSNIRAQIPASLGAKTAANSLSVAIASDAIAYGTGNVTTSTQRVTLASDDVAVNLLTSINNATAKTIGTIHASVGVSTTSVVLLAANDIRQRIIIANDSTQSLYIKIGSSTASIASGGYSLVLPPKNIVPAIVNFDQAYGSHLDISGIWSGSDPTGFVNIVSYFI